jgi:hypothetical protein
MRKRLPDRRAQSADDQLPAARTPHRRPNLQPAPLGAHATYCDEGIGSRVVAMWRDIRTSNAEREAAVALLTTTIAEGRITVAEFDEWTQSA